MIAHSLDAMCSVRANPVSDGLAVRAAKLAFENLEAAFRDGSDAVARERMAMASTIAGYAFSNTGTTGSHACSYLLTAKYHIPMARPAPSPWMPGSGRTQRCARCSTPSAA